MKIKLSQLRKIIKETVSVDMVEEPLEQLRKTISAMAPNDVAATEYVDSESGEIYLSKGDLARDSVLHPQWTEDRDELARLRKKWAEEDAAADYNEPEEDDSIQLASDVKEFASNWSSFEEESPDITPEDAASDAALGFFVDFPQWRNGSNEMSRSDILSWVVDEVYEAMILAH